MSREGKSVPCGSCTLWSWPSLLGLEVGSARWRLCAVPSARQGHAFLPPLGPSGASSLEASRKSWLTRRKGRASPAPKSTGPSRRPMQDMLGSPSLLHREWRKLTQIYAFNKKKSMAKKQNGNIFYFLSILKRKETHLLNMCQPVRGQVFPTRAAATLYPSPVMARILLQCHWEWSSVTAREASSQN